MPVISKNIFYYFFINIVKEEGKGKDVVITPLKISENELVLQEENLPSGHINQNQDDQSKGKGKEPIIIESDEEMEYTTPKINEKHDNTKPDKEYLEIIEPSEIKILDEDFDNEKVKNIVTAPLEIKKMSRNSTMKKFSQILMIKSKMIKAKGRIKLLKKVKVLKLIEKLWRIFIKLLGLSIQANL
uniref:Uncharacterized protein n=1 Tax=Meloidogyne enterolobii TaxID=390850 RepID=A0A6V7TTC7_MELEN|nr:unnamed protein product [Meloidogyne enterolobii]